MIKMVVCDVDGTLLKRGETELSTKTIDTIKKLTAKGIVFVVASGRTYTDLKRLFAAVDKDIVYAAHDGAITVYKGSVLAKHPIDHKPGFEFMKKVYKKDSLIPVVYSSYMTYVLRGSGDFGNTLRDLLHGHVTEVDCFDALKDDYLKIGLYKKGGAVDGSVLECAKMAGLSLVYEDSSWQEYVIEGMQKGAAVNYLQKRFAITKAETMVFGDNTNDIGMFGEADYAYAVEWAPQAIKDKCGYVTTDVTETLKSVFSI